MLFLHIQFVIQMQQTVQKFHHLSYLDVLLVLNHVCENYLKDELSLPPPEGGYTFPTVCPLLPDFTQIVSEIIKKILEVNFIFQCYTFNFCLKRAVTPKWAG